MVEFNDRSVKAQLGIPDMKIPIQYALTHPIHKLAEWEELDLAKIGNLTFEEKDLERFPCIELAYESLRIGGSAPAVLNVANDLLVELFINDKILFDMIPKYIEQSMNEHNFIKHPSIKEISELTSWTENHIKQIAEI